VAAPATAAQRRGGDCMRSIFRKGSDDRFTCQAIQILGFEEAGMLMLSQQVVI